MANYNRVILMGNLTRDPELRYIPSGQAVTTFTVAMNRQYTLQSGEKREEATFVRVVAWARMAETCAEYLVKGSPVFVEGRLQSRSWETPQGEKRSTIEVVAQTVKFLSRREETKAARPEGQEDTSAAKGPEFLPEVDVPARPEEFSAGGPASTPVEPSAQKAPQSAPAVDEEAPF